MIEPFTDERPWGSFRQFTHNEKSTVKLLHIKSGQEFSLQSHMHRKEFWHVITGEPTVTIGETITQARPGDEFVAEIGQRHRISVLAGMESTTVLEISFGTFDEDDIERLDDKYGRP